MALRLEAFTLSVCRDRERRPRPLLLRGEALRPSLSLGVALRLEAFIRLLCGVVLRLHTGLLGLPARADRLLRLPPGL